MRPETGIRSTQGPVARIRKDAGGVCGSGLLVSDRHVMTCAHVVDDAVPGRRRGDAAAPGETEMVTLDLPFLDRRGLTARVVAWYPMVDDVEGSPVSDIAVLELEEGVAGGLDPREAVLSAPPPGTAFTTWGFPRDMDGGAEAGGELRMRDAGGWRHIQDTQDHGYFVEPGFSGAPIFDAEAASHGTRKFLGMVVAADRDDKKRLAFVIPTPTLGRAWPLLVRPYKGLDAFEAEDADLFFGRQEKVGELAAKVAKRPFVALIGPSGSGKSSLVRAGLVPRLRAGGDWATATLRPQDDPLYELAKALAGLSPARVGDELAKRAEELAGTLRENPRRILDYVPTVLDAIPGADRLLLVVDQFEELFTLAAAPGAIEDPATSHGTLAAVLECIGAQPPDEAPIRIVATLRADTTGHALRHGVFERLTTDADVLLGPMSPADLTDAVAMPAERFGVTFDPGLVSEIVTTMKDSRGGLPLMQFALDRLWQRQADRRLSKDSYTAIGGVEGALNDHAEAFRKDLSSSDQDALRRVMARLVTLANPGTGSEDTRAVATRHEIGEADWDLVGRLAKARLVTTGGAGGEAGTETAEIAHEALIRAWGTLRAWLEADRAFILWQQGLRHDVERWVCTNNSGALRGEQLVEAEAWLTTRGGDLNNEEREYIKASVDRRIVEEKATLDKKRTNLEETLRQSKKRIHNLEQKNEALRDARKKETRGEEQVSNNVSFFKSEIRSLGFLFSLAATGFLGSYAWIAISQFVASNQELMSYRLAEEARYIIDEVPHISDIERAAALAIESRIDHQGLLSVQVATRLFKNLPYARVEHDGPVRALAFSPDSTRIATGSDDGTARVLYADSADEIYRIGHGGPVTALAFSHDGTRLATGSGDGTARIVKAQTGEEVARIEPRGMIKALAFSHDGTRLAVAVGNRSIRILDTSTGAERWIVHESEVHVLVLSPDGTRLATGSESGAVRLLNAENGDEIYRMGYNGPVKNLAFSPDGTLLAIGSKNGVVRLLNARNGDEIYGKGHDEPVTILAFSRDGTRLASGGEDSAVRILNVMDGFDVQRIRYGGWVLALVFGRDRTLLAAGGGSTFSGFAQILDTANGTEVFRLKHGSRVWDIDLAPGVNPESVRLATGSEDGIVRLFEVPTDEQVVRTEEAGPFSKFMFSRRGDIIAAERRDGMPRIFHVDTNELLARLCTERAGRNLTRDEWRRYIGEDEPWRKTCPEWRTLEEISDDGQAASSSE